MSILGVHFFKTSNAIYSYCLGCRELAVYGYLRSRAGSKDYCWPSMQTIAAACGCSSTTARKAVDELERRGFIRRVPTYATYLPAGALPEPCWQSAACLPVSAQEGAPEGPILGHGSLSD